MNDKKSVGRGLTSNQQTNKNNVFRNFESENKNLGDLCESPLNIFLSRLILTWIIAN